MENREISRRETLNLAKFGLLLAAGLGVVERSSAEDPQRNALMQKGVPEIGGFSIKLFKYDGANFALLKTMNVPAVQAKIILADKTTQVTIKFWRPASVGKSEQTLGSLSDTLVKL